MKSIVRCVALAGVIGASLMGSAAQADQATVQFSFLNGSTIVADGSLTYLNHPASITSYSGLSAFSITFHSGALTDTYVLSQLVGLPSNEQFVDFDSATNQFGFAPDADFYNIPIALAADNGPIDFFIQNQAGSTLVTDNNLALYNAPVTAVRYVVTVPEPRSVAMFGAGLLGLGLIARRRKSSKV